MKYFAAVALILLTVSSCNSDKKSSAIVSNETKDTFIDVVTHSFSDLNALDTFRVKLTGTKPDSMVLAFTIHNTAGEEIYAVNIKGTDLLGSFDPNVDLRKEVDQIAFIKNIAKEFLSEESFLDPAVTDNQSPDDYTPDKAFYQELKTSKLNGFTYRLGKENNIYIAWSQQNKKVMVYYNCC